MESNKKDDIPKSKKKPVSWAVKATVITFFISFFLGVFADILSKNLSFVPALLVLVFIILVGIIADMAGIAVATADEKTLNAMAARKMRGAKEALSLLKSAEKATSIFNDVIGDIAGIISGATGATIGVYVIRMLGDAIASGNAQLGELITLSMLSAVIASLTVGGKAAGKKYAIKNAEKIVYLVGRIAYFCKRITNVKNWFRKER